MVRYILIPLRKSDQIEPFLPYVEQLAQPGTKVVLLVHYGVNGFKLLLDQLRPMPTAIAPIPSGKRDLLNEHRLSVEQRMLPACEALRLRGVQITVNVYAGSLRRMLRRYEDHEGVYLLIMQSGLRQRLKQALRSISSRFFKATSIPPVLLLHSGKQH